MVRDQDQLIFDTLVPADHSLRPVIPLGDFEQYRAMRAVWYHASDGRPADDPGVRVKIGFLQPHDTLSVREVLAAIQGNVAVRFCRNLALPDTLPHPSFLTVVRARLGATRSQHIFEGVVAPARTAGRVNDRVRLTDATHVSATSALPSTMRLIAQMRERRLSPAEPFAPAQGAAARAHRPYRGHHKLNPHH